jgi:hypothetical protein
MNRQCSGLSARNRRFWEHESTSSRCDSRLNAVAGLGATFGIRHAGKKKPGAGIVESMKLELFSAILDHACTPIMAIYLSSHTEGTTPPGALGQAAVWCTVPQWVRKPGTPIIDSQRFAYLLAQGTCVSRQIRNV